jgi:hypothetical protein
MSQQGLTAQQQFQLLNKATAAKTESRGFNLDSLANSPPIRDLFASYDQVQVKNGNQSVLLQRSTADHSVAPQADVNAAGSLQVLPDVGGKAQAYQKQALAARAAETPTWEKWLLPIGAGVGGLILLVIVLKG